MKRKKEKRLNVLQFFARFPLKGSELWAKKEKNEKLRRFVVRDGKLFR